MNTKPLYPKRELPVFRLVYFWYIELFDHIGNEDICDLYGVAPIVEKLRERRLRWYGHVIYVNENSLAKISLNIEVDGKRPKGRPVQRWLDALDGDLKTSRLHPDQAFDRAKCRNRSRRANPACERDKG